MKSILPLLLLILTSLAFVKCTDKDDIIDPSQGNATFKAVITGDENRTIEVKAPVEGIWHGVIIDENYMAIGGYTSEYNELVIMVSDLGLGIPILILGGTKAGGFSTGNYLENEGVGLYFSYSNLLDPNIYEASSSMISITKTEWKEVGVVSGEAYEFYWADGTFEMTMENLHDDDTPLKEIQITGTFKNFPVLVTE